MGRANDDSGLYTPKWISTTYTMLLVRDFGLEAENENARKACALLLDSGLKPDGGIDYGTWAKWTRRGETCVTAMVLSLLSSATAIRVCILSRSMFSSSRWRMGDGIAGVTREPHTLR